MSSEITALVDRITQKAAELSTVERERRAGNGGDSFLGTNLSHSIAHSLRKEIADLYSKIEQIKNIKT